MVIRMQRHPSVHDRATVSVSDEHAEEERNSHPEAVEDNVTRWQRARASDKMGTATRKETRNAGRWNNDEAGHQRCRRRGTAKGRP